MPLHFSVGRFSNPRNSVLQLERLEGLVMSALLKRRYNRSLRVDCVPNVQRPQNAVSV